MTFKIVNFTNNTKQIVFYKKGIFILTDLMSMIL